MLNAAIWNVRGLNMREHQIAVRNLVADSRLHFIGLLETRVTLPNVTRVQSNLLPRWKWFSDYNNPGNWIWLAWNDEFIDVDVVDIGVQYIHCRILIHSLHTYVLVTVAYGDNEIGARRELWQALCNIAGLTGQEPWLVGGDFNAVRDMSEVCGTSGDIRLPMHEFNDCILRAGLIALPMRGVQFSWHNCSTDGRSLWKRLDRMLVNDTWLERWPDAHYECLTPRTSDHSPLLLRGDTREPHVNMFRFDNFLALSPGFIASVQNIWRHRIIGTPMYSVTRKLKALKLISDEDGRTYTEPRDVSATFIEFFRRLFGGERVIRNLDLRYLRPWARHIITEEEAISLSRPITADDVKNAIFDIEEDRVPGLDGFPSGFFKAAWPVVGAEVTAAVKDFFAMGKLLKQVNATLLTLIPKVIAPSLVADFRPISCCNVIYKIITKILVHRIREVLDKLISPSQNAFVPGRSISENILLAQELFSGYNQCRFPPRCALKVDLRKAYDTVEWDFLIATLHLFGFPMEFIRWIDECVTTPHFSLYLNGEDGDFAYHWQCKDLRLFQLSFADDLILLWKAEARSVNLFRRGLEVFASLSGLHTNPQKSQLIISKAAQGLRMALIDTLGFREGKLPVRYLGLPLISSRLTISDCQPLFQKIDGRINGWEGTNLSFAGRVQLIKSILLALGVYWAMAFLLPKGVIKEIVKRLRQFLWKGTTVRGCPKVAWELVCRPVEEGGQGIWDILALNRALTSRHLWSVICHDRTSIWVDWIIYYRLRGKSVWAISPTKGAWGWRKMLTLRNILLPHIQFRVGSGDSFSIWHDPWHCLGPLILAFPRGPQLTQTAPHDL
ncbi:UNVERIFIED_CONTAM: hypothetical protein Sangu_3221500 [Sesamum angustifolium]|uniref:Reverse transcriptase domain-containing protein n=1 Tax=Sesamum angustifolium TaxID=2727405 RepID=A0AAW2JIR5_9LAMI